MEPNSEPSSNLPKHEEDIVRWGRIAKERVSAFMALMQTRDLNSILASIKSLPDEFIVWRRGRTVIDKDGDERQVYRPEVRKDAYPLAAQQLLSLRIDFAPLDYRRTLEQALDVWNVADSHEVQNLLHRSIQSIRHYAEVESAITRLKSALRLRARKWLGKQNADVSSEVTRNPKRNRKKEDAMLRRLPGSYGSSKKS